MNNQKNFILRPIKFIDTDRLIGLRKKQKKNIHRELKYIEISDSYLLFINKIVTIRRTYIRANEYIDFTLAESQSESIFL